MTRARLMFGSLALALVGPLVLPPPAQAARDHSRGNVEAVDWSVMQIAIRTPNGRTVTYKVAPRASVKFTDCPECFPSPTYRDLAPPMYVHFEFEDLDVDEIQSFDVKEIGNAPRRVTAGSSGSSGSSSSIGSGSQTLKVKVLTLDERRGSFVADVAGRRQSFRADRGAIRDLREGDLVVITVERQGNEDVVTRVEGAGRSGRVTQIDKRRGEIGIEVNGRERFYRVENDRMLERVKEGDRVTFDVETRNGQEVVTTLER
jgi:Cu/Ag efflux protein CusF